MFKTIVVLTAVLLSGALAANTFTDVANEGFGGYSRGAPADDPVDLDGSDFFDDGGSFKSAHQSGGGDDRWRGVGTGWDTGFAVSEAGLWTVAGDISIPVVRKVSLMARVELLIGPFQPIIGLAFDTGVRFHFDLHRRVTLYADAKASIAAFDSGVWASGAGVAGTFGVEYGDQSTRLYAESGIRAMVSFRSGGDPLGKTPDFATEDMRRLTSFQWTVFRIGLRVYMR